MTGLGGGNCWYTVSGRETKWKFRVRRIQEREKHMKLSLSVSSLDKCKICGSEKLRAVGEVKEFNRFFKEHYEQLSQSKTMQCNDCGFLENSSEVQLTKEVLTELYNIDYFSSHGEVKVLKNLYEKRRFLALARKAIGKNLNGLSLLDIGCGAGEYLKIGSDLGMSVTGYDVDSSIEEYIMKTYKFEVVSGDLNDNTFNEGSFDVIVLSHVIEHLNNPKLMVKNIHKFLKKDGVLVLTMPNPNALIDNIVSFAKRVISKERGDTRLTPYITPFHINGFSLKSTRFMLLESGFQIKHLGMISGLSWTDSNLVFAKKIIRIVGYLMGRGAAIICIAQK
jgi:2-polyprenyl-3-methyl-5-hydroxy-6-metoxy-1,4-benzoquinol methylase